MSTETTTARLRDWFSERGITEVECLVPDITGEAKGKIVPAARYLAGERPRLPDSIFIQTVTGDYPDNERELIESAERDMQLIPDPDTCCLVPWAHEPTAQIIHDCRYLNGEPVTVSPRYVLGRVLELFAQVGLKR